jgi:aryl-alcohol dehydrogenase-like predicted oxidoreductase
MGMSDFYGPADRTESLATIDAALESGITLLDTGDFYGMGHNELLLREALKGGKRDQVVLSVKFGAQRGPDGAFLGFDARPAAVKTWVTYSLKRLGTDHIDVYRPARLDPAVPIEETAGAVADLIKAGYVRHLGLSEVNAETVRRANAVTPVTDLQIEYSLLARGTARRALPALRELGVAVTAYGVLGRGLISDKPADPNSGFRGRVPRFQGENYAKNLTLVAAIGAIAREKGVTTAQIAMAWALAQGEDIVPLIGARRRASLAESLKAAEVSLSQDDLRRLEAATPPDAVAGTRYDSHQMAMLNSET